MTFQKVTSWTILPERDPILPAADAKRNTSPPQRGHAGITAESVTSLVARSVAATMRSRIGWLG